MRALQLYLSAASPANATAERQPGPDPENGRPSGLASRLRAYATPDPKHSIQQLLVTVVVFAALWCALWLSLDVGYWLTLLLSPAAAGFLIRLFVIQHDCGHHAYFRHRAANDMVGRALSVLTLTPYGHWRSAHAMHHATSGDLGRRGVGDITTLTVAEYRALSPTRRFVYRLFRHPLVLFGLVPIFLFVVVRRMPIGVPLSQRGALSSVLAHDLALAALVAAMAMLVGTTDFLLIQLPITLIAASFGVWLFFVQHQFEHAYWRRSGEWRFEQAALAGSSYLRLPQPLQWLTGSIGLHHVHHLCSRIPNYRLQECLDATPELRGGAQQLSFAQSLRSARLALWCEARQRMIRFRDLEAPEADRAVT
ncbi:MAG: fatty acid desaturase [Alphaproteobacteria bacterium]